MTLRDYLSEENVVFNKEFSNWQDAIRFAGRLLIQSGSINATYCEDMIKTVEKYGPYIVIMPGVALAHARPNGNVLINQIALISMPEGVDFGNPQNDPVHFLFAIAARTDREHMEIFKTLASFLSIEENLKALQTATCFEEIGL